MGGVDFGGEIYYIEISANSAGSGAYTFAECTSSSDDGKEKFLLVLIARVNLGFPLIIVIYIKSQWRVPGRDHRFRCPLRDTVNRAPRMFPESEARHAKLTFRPFSDRGGGGGRLSRVGAFARFAVSGADTHEAVNGDRCGFCAVRRKSPAHGMDPQRKSNIGMYNVGVRISRKKKCTTKKLLVILHFDGICCDILISYNFSLILRLPRNGLNSSVGFIREKIARRVQKSSCPSGVLLMDSDGHSTWCHVFSVYQTVGVSRSFFTTHFETMTGASDQP